jgi:imidazolonepropionase-like amidohydrolase
VTGGRPRVHAIRSTHAFDGERFLPSGATVLVEDERIVGVEPFAHHLPDDVEVLEHHGTLLPSLIDCHSHLVADSSLGVLERAADTADTDVDATITRSLRAPLAAGVTTVRDLGDSSYGTVSFAESVEGLPRGRAAQWLSRAR